MTDTNQTQEGTIELTEKQSQLVRDAADSFSRYLMDKFETDSETNKSLTEVFVEYASPLVLHSTEEASTGRKRKNRSSTPKKPRQLSGYNLFVKSEMLSEEVQSLDHGVRMKSVGAKWSSMSPADKETWKEKARLASAHVDEESSS
jgi:hypothetical protein